MAQWLGLGVFIAMPQVQSLVGELRSHKCISVCGSGSQRSSNKLEYEQKDIKGIVIYKIFCPSWHIIPKTLVIF